MFHIIILNKKANRARIYNLKFVIILSVELTVFVLCITCVYDSLAVRYTIILFVSIVMILKRRYFLDKLKNK